MGPREAPDTDLVQSDDNRYPPARGEGHKTRDNQLKTQAGPAPRKASAPGDTQGTTRTFPNSQIYIKQGRGKKD